MEVVGAEAASSSTTRARELLSVVEEALGAPAASFSAALATKAELAILGLKSMNRVAHEAAHEGKERVREARVKTDALYLNLQNILEEKESLLLELQRCLETDADEVEYCGESASEAAVQLAAPAEEPDEELKVSDLTNAYEVQMISRLKRVKTELKERTRLQSESVASGARAAELQQLAHSERLELDRFPSLTKTLALDKAVTQALGPAERFPSVKGGALLPRPMQLVVQQLKAEDVAVVTGLSLDASTGRVVAELKSGVVEATFMFAHECGVLASFRRGSDGKIVFPATELEAQAVVPSAAAEEGFRAYAWAQNIAGLLPDAKAWVDLPSVLESIVADAEKPV